ncbi:MAG: bifunctional tRNA (5-methylaminomethyl-2-thiouridine)(34)-methyltransferase MnmD/FAD-dependent 5-carboxymethylaminomethyl-2-thiouridine(34) oxidoreductase MnmC [Zoogloeaceae bacterium]|jgi:tRNA 5-methylaminomethyl-2-thiouridine biosynthesis bifunctional protein|nr:bifunctional tRNA (5-methylaminomethyl-2-thiouridine)(34)-methyltransferase MnmD/FAD-dependent 5-carboxymethylaminomethyl-2-thiouridine(34) oxidoreductase MnmC [Zoogloeaceae bacterium]
MIPLQPGALAFTPEGTPCSGRYGDVYHTRHGGPEQARHVFLGGNDLPERWRGRERFVILETGFGLGLNFLATWACWQADANACRVLHYVSVEKHPLPREDLARAQALWPEFAPLAEALRKQWPLLVPGIHRIPLAEGRLVLTLVFGDAVHVLRRLMLAADAFYLDGFAPEKNPDLWSPEICHALARLAAPGATLATWSVAGALRRALAANEFDLEKRPGFAEKRQMLAGRYRSRKPARYALPAAATRQAIIIGAGVAGSSAAAALAARGWRVTVLERRAAPGEGASGNLAGVMRPLPSADDNFLARLTRAGFLAASRHLAALAAAGLPVRWGQVGALHLARDAAQEAAQARTAQALGFPAEFLQYLNATASSHLLDFPVPRGGWYFPQGGWVMPRALCTANLLASSAITFMPATPVGAIRRGGQGWEALDDDGKPVATAPHLVLAGGVDAPRFAPLAWLPQRSARGQVSWLPADQAPPLRLLVCGKGYVTPPVDGVQVAGASFRLEDENPFETLEEHQENLQKLEDLLPGFTGRINARLLQGRVGFRPMSPDRLPIVGPVPDPAAPRRRHMPKQAGLWCLQGFGSRGIVWSALMADLLASQMHGDPLPLSSDLVRAVAPERFLIRHRLQPESTLAPDVETADAE